MGKKGTSSYKFDSIPNNTVKVRAKKYDDKEDMEIKEIAYSKITIPRILFYVLIALFLIMLCSTTILMKNYNHLKNNKDSEVISIVNDKNRVTIFNNGYISQSIEEGSFTKGNKILKVNINSIELTSNKNAIKDGVITYNIKYDITKNDYPRNVINTNDSEVLVRFSYSYDGTEWIDIKNVISSPSFTISPLMGDYYDISGVVGTLSIERNYKLETKAKTSNKIFWRSETLFQNVLNSVPGDFEANFKIEYQGND